MKLLLDACVWGGAVPELLAIGYDVIWVGNWDADPGDSEILARAYADERVLVTLDKDFGDLAILVRLPHAGIIRLVNISAATQAAMIHAVLGQYTEELRGRAIITVEPSRIRIRAETKPNQGAS